MAVTAKFQADFSGFVDAINKAEVKLVDLSKGANKVEGSLNRMVDGFSGRRVIQEATLMAVAVEKAGGVATLTAKELERIGSVATEAAEKLKKLGHDVPASIQQIADATKGASTEWDAFVKGFSVEQAIASPLGTAKSAIIAFTESMGAVAVTAAATVAGIAAVGVAVYKLAASAAAVGGNLDDMADKTGMSVPALSRLQNAAAVAGTDLNTLTDAVFKIEQRMGEGGEKWDAALKKMGLSTEDLRNAGPDRLLDIIATGLAGIADPSERAATGVALMGKGFKDVVPILADLNSALLLTNDITPWTAAQAADAEHFEMQMASLVVHAEALGTALGRDLIPYVSAFVSVASTVGAVLADVIGRFSGITSMLNLVGGAWTTAAAAIEVFRGVAAKIPPVTGDASKAVETWKKSVSDLQLKIPSLTDALRTEEFAVKALNAQHAELVKSQDKATASAQRFTAEFVKSTEAVHHVEAGFYGLHTAVAALDSSEIDAVKSQIKLRDEIEKIEQSAHIANFGFKGMADGLKNVGTQVDLIAPKLATSLTDSLKGIPDIIIKAFEGGGGLAGGLKALAVKLGVDFGKALNDGLKNAVSAGGSGFNSVTGKAAAATGALAGLGAAASGASAKAAAASVALTGVSVAAGAIGAGATISGAVALGAATAGIGLAAVGAYYAIKYFATNTEKAINPVRQKFIDAAGGLEAMNVKAKAAGITLDKLLQAKNATQYAAAIAEINRAFTIFDAKALLATNATNDLLRVIQQTGGLIPDAMKAGIEKLIEMQLITGDTADAFAALAGNTEVDFKTLSAIASKYGADLTKLGPAFEKARLGDLAKGIVNDFDTLTRGLGDVDEALMVMKKPIGELVGASLKAGIAIPKNFEPWVKQLLLTGQLTDKNGDKIEDISELKFADPIVSEFDKIVAKLQELIDKITGTIRGIGDIPRDIGVAIHYDDPGPPRGSDNYAAMGGLVTGAGIQYLAKGGKVLQFAPRGTDTVPAMLTPGEGVVSRRGMKTLGAAGLSAINRGGGWGGGAQVVGLHELRSDVKKLTRQLLNSDRRLPERIKMAVAGR